MGYAILGKHSITCFRGGTPLANMKMKVKDRKNNEWYCKCSEEEFNRYPDSRSVEVYDNKGRLAKKFLKGFLTIVEMRS